MRTPGLLKEGVLMPRPLPLRVSLEWLKKLCKQRLDELRIERPTARLSAAQLAVAREFGFPSWQKLKVHVDKQREKLDALVPLDVRSRAAGEVVAPDDPDFAALLVAIAAGQAQTVANLVAQRPALAVARAADGQTPLHLAARYNDENIAAVLVAYGADVEARFGQSSHTALSWAVTCSALDCACALVKLGAEPDLFCAAGLGALEEVDACFDSAGRLIRESRSGSSRFAADGSRLPSPPATAGEQVADALSMACRNGHAQVVRYLLEKQPDLSFRSYLGATALHWAYFGGSREVIGQLLEAGADPTARDATLHCTPRAFGVAVAASWGFDFIVRRLLADDPQLANAVDSHTSPLHEAGRGGHSQVVRLLLENGANPDVRDGDGKTPLEIAVARGHETIVQLVQGF